MTALNPPTRASEPDEEGRRHSEHRSGSLGTQPMDPAPCEATDGHPVLADLPRFHVRGPGERLFEEAYDWARDLTDAECMQRYLVGIDVNLAFGACRQRRGRRPGIAPRAHRQPGLRPSGARFLAGRPLPRRPVPGEGRQAVAPARRRSAAQPLHADRRTPEVRPGTPPPPWRTPSSSVTTSPRLRHGCARSAAGSWTAGTSGCATPTWTPWRTSPWARKLAPHQFLEAMDGYRQRDAELAIVVDAIKMTVKGSIGKLQEKARGGGWKPGQPWPALARPTWRPDIRATVISRARINMHRKMLNLAAATGRYPVAVLSDCAVYAANGPSPLDVLPYGADGKTVPGSFRLGVSPGMVKHEGTQSVPVGRGRARAARHRRQDRQTSPATSRPARSPPRTPGNKRTRVDGHGRRRTRQGGAGRVHASRSQSPPGRGCGTWSSSTSAAPGASPNCSVSVSAPSSGT